MPGPRASRMLTPARPPPRLQELAGRASRSSGWSLTVVMPPLANYPRLVVEVRVILPGCHQRRPQQHAPAVAPGHPDRGQLSPVASIGVECRPRQRLFDALRGVADAQVPGRTRLTLRSSSCRRLWPGELRLGQSGRWLRPSLDISPGYTCGIGITAGLLAVHIAHKLRQAIL
jgi:hypothetical protein